MFEYSLLVREVHPFVSEPRGVHATVGVRVYEHRRGAELWVVPGSQDEELELSDALLPLLPVHTLTVRLLENMTDEENVYAVEFVGARVDECIPCGGS